MKIIVQAGGREEWMSQLTQEKLRGILYHVAGFACSWRLRDGKLSDAVTALGGATIRFNGKECVNVLHHPVSLQGVVQGVAFTESRPYSCAASGRMPDHPQAVA